MRTSRTRRIGALIAVCSVALLAAAVALADVENGSLPAGTSISVSIASPADGAVLPLGSVAVSGAAAVGTGTVIKDTTVVYVVDQSGSMVAGAGVDCTGDGINDNRLTCVKAAVEEANTAASAAGSSVDLTGLAAFHSSATAFDVDLGAAGTQYLVSPAYDGNGNANPDVEDAADSLGLLGATCYSCGLQAAKTILLDPANANTVKLVIFLSDGFNNVGPAVSSVSGFPAGTAFHAFALGTSVSCSAGGSFGDLNDVAAIAPGGSCTETTDFASVGGLITEAIGSTLASLSMTVDGSPASIGSISASLPAAGPVSVLHSSSLSGLAAGVHNVCVTASGTDAGGAGSLTDCHSFRINAPPSCADVAANASTLWPPNHKWRSISLSGATDSDGTVSISITGIRSDEPVDAAGSGDGNTRPDAIIAAGGSSASLRAERQGAGDGRVYTIAYSATDNDGASCSGSIAVGVPHDMSGAAAVDSGPAFDATLP